MGEEERRSHYEARPSTPMGKFRVIQNVILKLFALPAMVRALFKTTSWSDLHVMLHMRGLPRGPRTRPPCGSQNGKNKGP